MLGLVPCLVLLCPERAVEKQKHAQSSMSGKEIPHHASILFWVLNSDGHQSLLLKVFAFPGQVTSEPPVTAGPLFPNYPVSQTTLSSLGSRGQPVISL